MSIWITRPKEDGLRLQQELSELGLHSIVEPLSEVEFLSFDVSILSDVAGLIATSRNGLKAFAAAENLSNQTQDLNRCFDFSKQLPLFAVGQSTANLAGDLGFKDVRIGGGRAETLVDMILEYAIHKERDGRHRVQDGGRKFVHLRGDRVAFDLETALREKIALAQNFELMPVHCYKVTEAEGFSTKWIERLKNGEISSVVLMSPRVTRIYLRLMVENKLLNIANDIDHCCLSEAVAEPLGELGIAKVRVAAFPDQSHIKTLLKTLYLS